MEQPIKYSDLILPDDSIEKLIRQLNEATEAYNRLGNSIKAEAERLSNAMSTISGATAQGRNATRGYSQDAERLLKAERELNFARSETARKIAELNAEKRNENTITKLTVQLNRSAEGSYNALSAQYSLNKVRLNAMTEAERQNTEAGKKLEQETREIYERMNELQKATGKYTLQVGNYERALGSLTGIQGRWLTNLQTIDGLFKGGLQQGIKSAGTAVAGFGKQLLALLANPIVAIIAAVAAAFMALSKAISTSEENTRALERIMAPFERLLTGILNVLQETAGFILRVVEGFENMAMAASRFAERLPVVGKYLRDVNNAMAENVRLTREKQELEDMERNYSVQNALAARNAAKFRADAEKTDDPKRRAQLLKMAQAEQQKAMYNELQLARKDLDIKKAKAKQSQNDAKTNEELAQARARLYQVEERYYQQQVRMNSKLCRENTKANNTGTASGGGSNLKQLEDDGKKRIEIIRQIEDVTLANMEDGFDKQYRLTVVKYDRQIEDLRERMQTEVGMREEYARLIEQLEVQKAIKLSEIVQKNADEETKSIEKVEKEKREMEEKRKRDARQAMQVEMDVVNKENELRQLEIDNMETSEREKTRLRIEAEKERIKKIYQLNVAAGKDLNSLEMQILREQMKQLEQETEKNNKGKNLFERLGINLTEEQQEALDTAFDYSLQSLQNYMQAWQEAADRKVEMANREVDAAKSALDAEIEARNNGYANNVEMAQKELQNAKKNQEKALREQERAQKAQILLDTALQASNLVTATTEILKLGFPWFIPALAIMWGTFAAAKIKALTMTKSSEEYGEGTVELLQGGSHQSGNDVDLGRKKDGTRRRAEGGEFFAVINKRSSRRFRREIPDVINAFNNGTFAEKYMRAYPQTAGVTVVQNTTDIRQLQDDVSAIRRQGDRRTYFDSDGNMIEEYKNVRRKILKS